jgi:hypothetical protein
MQEFTNSIGWKIFYSVIAVLILLFSLILFFIPRGKSETQWVEILPALVTLSGLLILVTQFRRKVIVSTESVTSISAFGKKDIPISDIKGYSIGKRTITIQPLPPSDKNIIINNYNYLHNNGELVAWLKTNLTDLDASGLQAAQGDILQNPAYGATEYDRQENLKKARKIALAYWISSVVIGFGSIFIENNYASTVLGLGFPLVGILLMVSGKGIIKFVSNGKATSHQAIFLGFPLPPFMMLLKSLDDFSLFNGDNLWFPAVMIALIMTALLYVTGINRSMSSFKLQITLMVIISLLYGFAAARQINAVFDSSQPQVFQAKVIKHRESSGRSTTYYLTLSPWGPQTDAEETEVKYGTYNDARVGGMVNVSLKKGLFNAPWFTVTK